MIIREKISKNIDNGKLIKQIIFAVIVLILFLFVFYPKISGTERLEPASPAGRPVKTNPFKDIILEARAVYVFDIAKNEPIFEKNPLAQLPLASLTKIMTAIVAGDLNHKKQISNIANLIDSALAQSSNEAAIALASLDSNFINLMNKKAEELDLLQTYFLNETGLDISKNIAGAYGSAQDVAKLISYAIKNNPELFEATTNGEFNSNIYASTTTQLIASKTGFTDLAGGNLAVVFDAGFEHPVVAVALGSSKEGRFSDVQKLIEATYKYLEI